MVTTLLVTAILYACVQRFTKKVSVPTLPEMDDYSIREIPLILKDFADFKRF